MNRKETLKAHVISMCVKKKMTVKEGANRLGLSERQVKNLKARYKEKGVSSMLHGNCGRQPKHTLTLEIKERILQIKNEPYYQNVNFSHFHED
ncbi:MAG: helix-turn-helix domain-containing protein, partial [Clostridiales bacterium]|nr:helix-turn-helix domain-containing protein [Clostridiales bacterium]